MAATVLSGCAAIPLATAGTLAGIASSTVSTGSGLYKMGKLDSAEMVGHDEMVVAARSAAFDLQFGQTGYEGKPGETTLSYEDDLGATVKVTLQRRTAALTRCRIDVGLWGSEMTARLFLARLRSHLPPADDAAAVMGPSPEQNQEAEQ